MKINWKLRFKNVHFWIGLVCVILSPILAAKGITMADLTTWDGLLNILKELIQNPYLIGSTLTAIVSFLEVSNDPTRKGLNDSVNALTYKRLN